MQATDIGGKKIHFMGIGGIGVSALALMAHHAGADVSGCDQVAGGMIGMLQERGIAVDVGHSPGHVRDADLLVYSSAVRDDHPELLAAKEKERRGAFLTRLLDACEAWGVSGTHGKTTTTWLLARILICAEKDPSVFVGGRVDELGGMNCRIGTGPFVAELDESDGSFLLPELRIAVMTNVESEHLSFYGNAAALFGAFRRFAAGVGREGLLVASLDCPVCREILSGHRGRSLSFSVDGPACLSASRVAFAAGGTSFLLQYRGRDLGEFSLRLPGVHNVRNALAAAGAALEAGIDADIIRSSLAGARSVGRRMEEVGRVSGAVLYSDYAHHPTEVAAALAGLRQRHAGGILVAFQPHLYSRTRDYADAFGAALATADGILLTDIYPAREDPIPGIDAGLVADSARANGGKVAGPVPIGCVIPEVERLAPDFEAVVLMGAGSIDAVAREMVRRHAGDATEKP